jgi:hypothetical protein
MNLQRLTAVILLTGAGALRGTAQTRINPAQAKMGGPAASRPSSCTAGQIWLASDTGVLSYCSGAGAWNALASAGTGGGGSVSLCPVVLSATPVFDAGACSVFQLTLGGTVVTSSTLANARAGQVLTFLVSQDAAGGRSFAWPPNLLNGCAMSGAPGVTTILSAIFDGASANATSCTTTDDGTLVSGPTRSAPPTPSQGLSCWFDALSNGGGTWKCKDPSGAVHAAVQTAGGATANQVAKYIDADGVVHTGAVAEQELSLSDVTTANASTAAHGFLPKLPGDNTKCLLGDGTYGACGAGGGSGYTMTSGGVYQPLQGVFSAMHQGANQVVAAAAANGKFECYQWTAPVSLRLANLFTEKGGNGTSSDVFVAAVYQDNNNTPGAKVANSDVVLVGNTGVAYTEAPWGGRPMLSGGAYWMCYSNSNASGYWYSDSDPVMPAMLAFLSPARRVSCQNTVTYTGSSTTLPASCNSPSGNYLGSLPYMVIAQ